VQQKQDKGWLPDGEDARIWGLIFTGFAIESRRVVSVSVSVSP